MNANAKHTPGPWHTDNDGQIYGPNPEFDPTDPQTHEEILIADTAPDNAALTEYDEANARLMAAAPVMLEALRYAAELIPTARRYFPKSVKFSDRFQLENVCATIGKAIAQAEGGAQ